MVTGVCDKKIVCVFLSPILLFIQEGDTASKFLDAFENEFFSSVPRTYNKKALSAQFSGSGGLSPCGRSPVGGQRKEILKQDFHFPKTSTARKLR